MTDPAQDSESPRRLVGLVALLVLAAALIVSGVALWSAPASLIVAGVLVGALGIVLLVEVPNPPERER